jgi:hypothetical protein
LKILKTGLSLSTACALALTVGFLTHPAGIHAAAAPSATGAGHFQAQGGLRTFSFTARLTGPGTAAEGEAQLNNRGQDVVDHIQVDCLLISGNTADMGGTITSSSNPANVGVHGVFSVKDNGHGKNSPDDQMTLFFSPVAGCVFNFSGSYNNIDGGNVRVDS